MQSKNEKLKEPMDFFGPPGVWDEKSKNYSNENLIDPFIYFDDLNCEVLTDSKSVFDCASTFNTEKVIPSLCMDIKSHQKATPANIIFKSIVGEQENPEAVTAKNLTEYKFLESIKNTKRITAYEIMDNLLKKESILTLNQKIYRYNGIYYAESSKDEIARLFLTHCRREVADMGSSKQVYDAVNFILIEPKIHIAPDSISRNLLSLNNCVLDICTGAQLNHSKDIYTLYGINGNYIPNTYLYSTTFDNFLQTITGGDMLLTQRIYEFIGYLLVPDTNAKVFFVLQGVPNSGKSVLTTILSKLFSDNSVVTLDAHVFSDKYSISELEGKALCISPDMPTAPLDEKTVSKIKQITGNDVVSSNRKYESYIAFRCNAKIVLVTNHPVLTRSRDCAFEERAVTIPFRYTVPKEKQDSNLITRLLSERNSIITKSVNAYFNLVKNHYRFTGNYQLNEVVTADYESITDISTKIYNFVCQMFERSNGDFIFTEDAYKKYCSFNTRISLNEFSQYFKRYTEEVYNGTKDRKRKKDEPNAKSCICGIRWKGDSDSYAKNLSKRI